MKFHEKQVATRSMTEVWNCIIFKIPFYLSHSILWNVILPPKPGYSTPTFLTLTWYFKISISKQWDWSKPEYF